MGRGSSDSICGTRSPPRPRRSTKGDHEGKPFVMLCPLVVNLLARPIGSYEVCRSALGPASGNRRTAGQFQPEEKEQNQHRARSHCNSLEKAKNGQIQAHRNIVQRLPRRSEITSVIILRLLGQRQREIHRLLTCAGRRPVMLLLKSVRRKRHRQLKAASPGTAPASKGAGFCL
jgi:hypothetical protein